MDDKIKVEYGYYVKIDGVERREEIKSKNGMYYSENQNEDFIRVLEKHSKLLKKACQYNFEFHIGENIPIKKAKKVIGINHFYGLEIFELQDLIGIYDTSLFGNGKTGYYFFNNKLCFKAFENKIKQVIPYKNICEIETVYNECDKCIALKFKLDNEKVKVELVDSYIDKIALRDCIKELVLLSRGRKSLKCVDIKPSKIKAEIEEENSSKAAAVGKFLKNTAITIGGGMLNLSYADIEKLKKDNATEFVADLFGTVSDRSAEIAEKQAEREAKIEQAKENRTLLMTQEYRKAFKKRGLDYDKLYGNKYKMDIDYYLKTINMSRDEYYRILSEIKAEVNSIMEYNGF